MKVRSYILDGVLLYILAAVLVGPLYRTKYLTSWGSIESTFISDARFLAQNWPQPHWQPLWYCGTRFDYIYPPALRYGTAGLTKLFPIIPARAYHLYTAILYCLGIVGVYLLIRIGSGSRRAAWFGALATALVSPGSLMLRDILVDVRNAHYTPQRLNVLVRYGEGPHVSALALLGFALAAAWLGLQKGRRGALAVSALFCALVVSHNFYGANALAILFPVVVWVLWLTHNDHAIWLRAAVLGALAYGLTAFWLVPSYFRITMTNLRIVSEPGNQWSVWLAAGVCLVFGAATWKLARGRPERAYTVFVAGAALFLGLDVLGNYYFNFRVAGEPSRLIPELDLAIILLFTEVARRFWAVAPRLGQVAIVAAAAVFLLPATRYLPNAWRLYERDFQYPNRIEYRITDWLHENYPDARSIATGSVRFWYDAWFDLPQVGGGSEQGMLNHSVFDAQWQITGEGDVDECRRWMQALGADLIIVPFKNSQEIYHDFTKPGKFAGHFPVVYDNQQGDVIYRVPRRFPDRARVVETARLRSVPLGRPAPDVVKAYAEVIEDGPDSPARVIREGPDAMTVKAAVKPGESIVVQETYDPAWHAYSMGKALAVRPDPIGFMQIEDPPGDVHLVFELPFENRAGRVLTVLSLIVCIGLMVSRKINRQVAT